MTYRTIVADPPWPFQWSGHKGGRRRRETELGYKTMTVDEICALGESIKALADPTGCNLFLWVTDEMNAEGYGMKVARAWGFTRSGPSLIWRKQNFGMGVFPRGQHEQILVCRLPNTKCTWLEGANAIGSVHDWKQDYSLHGGKRHSRKPEGFLDLVERVSPGPYLELFARRNRIGWDTWGNESLEHVAITATPSYAETFGMDVTRCELCAEPLDDSQPWKRGLDGCGAHIDCLKSFGVSA